MTSSSRYCSVYRSKANRPLLDVLPQGVRTVLDVGCQADGSARALQNAARCVVGITVSREEAAEAGRWCAQVLVADIERDAIELEPESFDLLLLSHVVEYLARPTATLTRLVEYLVPGAWAAVAVPNMAFWRVRLRFLRRNWRRDEDGWFDRTHLQLWSYDIAPEVVSGTPLTLERREGGSFALPLWPLRRLAPSLSRRLDGAIGQRFPQAFAGQVLLLARKLVGDRPTEARQRE